MLITFMMKEVKNLHFHFHGGKKEDQRKANKKAVL